MIFVSMAALGLIVGSFLNVVILRLGEKSTRRRQGFGGELGGRSACPSCSTQLRWYDLIPLFSYVALKGRCRYCKARISIQYPLVEAATAIAFVLIGAAGLSLLSTTLALAIASLLICILVYDLYHKLIPDIWVWPFCILAAAYAIFNFQFSIFNLLAGPVAALPILFLWALSYPFTGYLGAWMGFGDVKLAIGIGWLLPIPTIIGLPLGLLSIFFAFIIGAVVSLTILLPLPYLLRTCGIRPENEREGYTMKSEVPFGPFLIASCFLTWFAVLYDIYIPFV